MPNVLAYMMLILWPLVCLLLFRRLPLERAIVWSILGGYLVLPPIAEFDLPLVPDMDKYAIPNISAFVICVLLLRRPVSLMPVSRLVRLLVLGFLLSVVPTVLTNSDPQLFRVLENADPIQFIVDQLPGLGWIDLFSVLSNQIIVLLPFLMARQYLSSDHGLREVLMALMVGGLIYSVPALIEVRLSPQINVWIYGFFQHSFEQMMRDGGFRPIVFLPHALWLAFFFMTALLATTALMRATPDSTDRARYLAVMAYLAMVLYLCKSLASLAYGLAFVPVVLLASPRMQVRLAILFALIAVVYPMLRNLGLIPVEAILAQAEAFNPARAQSLGFRFDNEDQLLARADERPWFGWGSWGRNLVRHSETGAILSIPDGRWIIVFGTFGWVGYLAEMGLLAAPLLLLGLSLRGRPTAALSPCVAPIAIILAATMVDMLLNATLIPYTWICAGAVLGYAERLSAQDPTGNRNVTFGQGPVIGRPNPTGRRTVL